MIDGPRHKRDGDGTPGDDMSERCETPKYQGLIRINGEWSWGPIFNDNDAAMQWSKAGPTSEFRMVVGGPLTDSEIAHGATIAPTPRDETPKHDCRSHLICAICYTPTPRDESVSEKLSRVVRESATCVNLHGPVGIRDPQPDAVEPEGYMSGTERACYKRGKQVGHAAGRAEIVGELQRAREQLTVSRETQQRERRVAAEMSERLNAERELLNEASAVGSVRVGVAPDSGCCDAHGASHQPDAVERAFIYMESAGRKIKIRLEITANGLEIRNLTFGRGYALMECVPWSKVGRIPHAAGRAAERERWEAWHMRLVVAWQNPEVTGNEFEDLLNCGLDAARGEK